MLLELERDGEDMLGALYQPFWLEVLLLEQPMASWQLLRAEQPTFPKLIESVVFRFLTFNILNWITAFGIRRRSVLFI